MILSEIILTHSFYTFYQLFDTKEYKKYMTQEQY